MLHRIFRLLTGPLSQLGTRLFHQRIAAVILSCEFPKTPRVSIFYSATKSGPARPARRPSFFVCYFVLFWSANTRFLGYRSTRLRLELPARVNGNWSTTRTSWCNQTTSRTAFSTRLSGDDRRSCSDDGTLAQESLGPAMPLSRPSFSLSCVLFFLFTFYLTLPTTDEVQTPLWKEHADSHPSRARHPH